MVAGYGAYCGCMVVVLEMVAVGGEWLCFLCMMVFVVGVRV